MQEKKENQERKFGVSDALRLASLDVEFGNFFLKNPDKFKDSFNLSATEIAKLKEASDRFDKFAKDPSLVGHSYE